ncbi:hypothetical protein MMC11_005046 [Xylographa trunciseda]|nr:hypothetical protein [Xylographa trunciseda]
MSRSYIGPVGSILPVPDDSNSPPPGQLPPPSRRSTSDMLAHHPPLLPLPSRLEFGSDPSPGFTDPTRYETFSRSRRSLGRAETEGKLPSLSQLLTPGSHVGATPSSFPPRLGSGSPAEVGSAHSSPYSRGYSTPRFTQADNYFQIPYTSAPSGHSLYPIATRETSQSYPSPITQPSLYPQNTSSNHHVRSSNPEFDRQVWPRPYTSPVDRYQWQRDQRPDSRSVPRLDTTAARQFDEAQSPLKPALKVVGEKVIPGEGPCYVYEDGSHVKKFIDGEIVNAQWGVTKAGKPRKRLAIACMTCREKKIKCDPGEPKVRGQHTNPGSPSYEHQARTPESSLSARTESHFDSLRSPFSEHHDSAQSPTTRPRRFSGASPTRKRSSQILSDASPLISPVKRPRWGEEEPDRRLETQIQIPLTQTPDSIPDELPDMHQESLIDAVDPLASKWSTDPYHSQPQLVMHYVDLYFTHINSATYRMFPRDPFLHWIQHTKSKSSDELMVLYAMLAIGSTFSNLETRKSDGRLFARIARYAVEKNHGQFSLQLAQGRLILALYHFSLGDASRAWDFCGSAVRVAAGLKMNLEQAIVKAADDAPLEFGLNRHALEECYRRTYWSTFLMDRYNGFAIGLFSAVQKEDVFLRLPCDELFYEKQLKTDMPYFDNGIIDKQLTRVHDLSSLGIMAYLVQFSSIWGDMHASIYRLKHQSPEDYVVEYQRLYVEINARLDSWLSALPSSLSCNHENITASIKGGYSGTLISVHSLYHIAIMILTRRVRHTCLPSDMIRRNIQQATYNAEKLLLMMQTLLKASSVPIISPLPSQDSAEPFYFSTPFPGYAILNAIDILSSAGSLNSVELKDNLGKWQSGLAIVEQLACFWDSARRQRRQITHRIEAIVTSVVAHDGEEKCAWVMIDPLEAPFGSTDQDIFYIRQPGSDITNTNWTLEVLGIKTEERGVLYIEDASGRKNSQESEAPSKCD